MNKADELCHAFPISVSNKISLNHLHLSEFLVDGGSSCHSIGEEVGFDLKFRKAGFIQGSVEYTLDRAVSDGIIDLPTHIKIDVDGFEHRVIEGAKFLLNDDKLRSLCIEINQNLVEHLDLVMYLKSFGFNYSEQQVKRSMRTSGPFKGCAEFIFDRVNKKSFFYKC